jgi:hypothetical protein
VERRQSLLQLNNIRGFILMEAKEKADEIRMKVSAANRALVLELLVADTAF